MPVCSNSARAVWWRNSTYANDILSGMQSIFLLGIENLVLPNASSLYQTKHLSKGKFPLLWASFLKETCEFFFHFSEAPSWETGATAFTCKDIWAFGHASTQTGNYTAHSSWVYLLNCHPNEAGKMALQFRAHTALAEDPRSVPGTYI